METHLIQQAYRRYALFYDFLFGRLLDPGRKLAVKIINKKMPVNAKILDVGVGTGLALPYYHQDLQITGVDLSEEMLQKARKRVLLHGMPHRTRLLQMDAMRFEFMHASFHAVVAMHTASVVKDLQRFLNEIHRVCVPGGSVIIVNHFTLEKSLLNFVEKKIPAFSNWLGFHPAFPIQPLLAYPKFKLLECYKVNFPGWWTLLHFENLSCNQESIDDTNNQQ